MISTFNSTAHRLTDGMQVEATSRDFKVLMDEPVEGGGTDKGMNPVELFLSAYGGCMTILAAMFAPEFDVKLDDFRVELAGDLDMDEGSTYNGFQEIRFTFHVKSSSPKENVEKMAAAVESNCPIGNTLREKVRLVFQGVVME